MRSRDALLLAVMSTAASSAFGEIRNYVVNDDGTCKPKADPDGFLPKEDPGQLTVSVAFPTGKEPKGEDVTLKPAGGAAITGQVVDSKQPAKTVKVELKGNAYSAGVDVEVKAKTADKWSGCGSFKTAGQSNSGESSDVAAQVWLGSAQGRGRFEELRKKPENASVTLLPHLPSGKPASPYPASVAEGELLQAVVVVDRQAGGLLPFSLDSCPKRDPFRILGDFSALGKAQALVEGRRPEHEFALIPVGPRFACGADKLVYSVGQSPADSASGTPAPTTLQVRPIYHLAATFIYRFDFARQSSFAVRDKKVVGLEDKVGTGLSVGFTWFPAGVDYERMTKTNHFLNPFLVFEVTNPKENFAAGLAFTPSGGVSLALGASFHKSNVLDGYAVDDAFQGDGDVPTRKVWNKDSIGLFVGVSVDSNVFQRVRGLWAATGGDGTDTGGSSEAPATGGKKEEGGKPKEPNPPAGESPREPNSL